MRGIFLLVEVERAHRKFAHRAYRGYFGKAHVFLCRDFFELVDNFLATVYSHHYFITEFFVLHVFFSFYIRWISRSTSGIPRSACRHALNDEVRRKVRITFI